VPNVHAYDLKVIYISNRGLHSGVQLTRRNVSIKMKELILFHKTGKGLKAAPFLIFV